MKFWQFGSEAENLLVIDSPDVGSDSHMYDECYGSCLSLQKSIPYTIDLPVRLKMHLRCEHEVK